MDNFVILALGSNLFDREENIKNACKKISGFVDISDVSSLYESEAFIPKNSPADWNKPFYNCIITAKTPLKPLELLERTQEVEKIINTNKRNKGTSEPRMLDIDIIAYNQEIINDINLQIPHPRMCERSFVIYPLAEILPNWLYYAKDKYYNKKVSEIVKELPAIKKLHKIKW